MHETGEIGVTTRRMDAFKCGACGCEIDVSEVPSFSTLRCPGCEHEQAVPALFGPFVLLELLGMGGMGASSGPMTRGWVGMLPSR